jgi:hypothetical protein
VPRERSARSRPSRNRLDTTFDRQIRLIVPNVGEFSHTVMLPRDGKVPIEPMSDRGRAGNCPSPGDSLIKNAAK